MKVVNGGKGKGASNGVEADVTALRTLFSEVNEMRRRFAILKAELQHKETEFNLRMTRACVIRNVLQGWGLDLADGKLKPDAEIQPYKD